MTLSRKVAVSLIATGAVLCGVYLVPTVYGSAMSHIAVARFRSQSTTNSLWDSARIRAYKRTLNLNFPAPEAVLRVPRLGIEVPVLEGTSDIILNRGVGHIAGTALPGQPGNIAITGHRDGFFRPLKDAREGDIIEVQRKSQTDRYVVSKIKIVFPSDTSVLNNTADSTLTLITCYPFYFVGAAPQRYIIQASLLPHAPTSSTATPATKSSGE